MNNLARKVYPIILLAISVLGLSAVSTYASAIDDATNRQDSDPILQDLDSSFQVLFNEYLEEYAKRFPSKHYKTSALLVQALDKNTDDITSSNIIRRNLQLLAQKSSSEEFSWVLERLYKSNDTAAIRDITLTINKQDDPTRISQNYFLLAKYYMERADWKGTLAALSKVDPAQLSKNNSQYYFLLKGYALQSTKQHRKAVPFYKKIRPESPYYAHARLNEGTAYLRQGWWTEAHIEFNKAIAALDGEASKMDEVFLNRILVVLGFSQIHYEFYRDARSTLRKVALDSTYTNKAMMGLGIAAAHQKDFPGALNIFELLLQKQPRDESVDEAYLLVPFGYEELNDKQNAAIKYQQAIQYYQMRLAELNRASLKLSNAPGNQLKETIEQLNLNAKELYMTQDMIPSYFLYNYNALINMQTGVLSTKMTASVKALLAQYKHQLQSLVAQNIELRQTTLNSYLSQAKFGVAKLYDQ